MIFISVNIAKYIVRVLWSCLFVGVLAIVTLFLTIKYDVFGLFGGLPSVQELERPNPDLSSQLISADGLLLGKYFRTNRTPVTYDELSPELINTLLVTEDIRFKEHAGIDLKGLLRAIFGALTFSFKGGGSTITMQLAENLYKTNKEMHGVLYQYKTLGRVITKLKEWIIAVQLEKNYTKNEILVMYLNTIEFGSNSFGIKVAAKTYFNKLPSQVNYSEAAVLVGLINAPTRWNPILNPENALRKRTEILYNLRKNEYIDQATYDSLNREPIELNYLVENHNKGLATYFRTVVRNDLLRWCANNGYDLFADGLKIHTTIDSRMQQYAESAMSTQMKKLQKKFIGHWASGQKPWIDDKGREIKGFLNKAIMKTDRYQSLKRVFPDQPDSIEYYLNQKSSMRVFSWNGEIDTVFSSYDSLEYYKKFLRAGFMAMNPKNGHIKAWVGGINHKYFKFDHVRQGKRQPGSTFKPIVYTAAIDNGYSPCFPVVDAPVSFDLPGGQPPWVPQNSNGKFSGKVMTIREAMSKSINSITAYMMEKITPQITIEYAKRLGIESPLDTVPSLCLGAGGDVSIYELAGAYSTFVNKGTYIKPFFIERIEDKNGNVIQQFIPDEKEVINEQTAYLMLHMLKGTVEIGTARILNPKLKTQNEIGAKTGTTQNASDGWFVGVTKDLVAASWVGGENRSIRFKYWTLGQGAKTAMPIWENFMLNIYADESLGYKKSSFEKPDKPLEVVINCKNYASDIYQYSQDAVTEDDFDGIPEI